MNFNKNELVDMVFVLGEADRNCFLASRIYGQRYPDRRKPDEKNFKKLLNRFVETGNVCYSKQARVKTAANEEKELSVLLEVTENPGNSQREISERVEISERSVQRILKKNKFHAYHILLHQELSIPDFEKRAEFCNWANLKIRQIPDFFNNVLFSDESTFHKCGFVNRHNSHFYATENPHVVRQVDRQHRWSINVWGGIIGEHIVGPHFFADNLNGRMYLDFLQNHLPRLLENVPRETRDIMWLQQDGAPAHYAAEVSHYLNQVLPNRWIGRNGPIKWPPRSPDLTKLDFFLWGYIKQCVYREAPTTQENMRERIRNAFQSATPDMLTRVSRSFEERINLCLEQNGQHIEHLL